jgi:hypothetical protein
VDSNGPAGRIENLPPDLSSSSDEKWLGKSKSGAQSQSSDPRLLMSPTVVPLPINP